MKSIKPGRGPSMMGGVMSIAVGVFGIIWTVIAFKMAGGVFALFGVVFVIVAAIQAVYNFKNATNKNRYSAFDITDGNEEPDPFNERYGEQYTSRRDDYAERSGDSVYCPYCGTRVEGDYEYCNRCGKKLP